MIAFFYFLCLFETENLPSTLYTTCSSPKPCLCLPPCQEVAEAATPWRRRSRTLRWGWRRTLCSTSANLSCVEMPSLSSPRSLLCLSSSPDYAPAIIDLAFFSLFLERILAWNSYWWKSAPVVLCGFFSWDLDGSVLMMGRELSYNWGNFTAFLSDRFLVCKCYTVWSLNCSGI